MLLISNKHNTINLITIQNHTLSTASLTTEGDTGIGRLSDSPELGFTFSSFTILAGSSLATAAAAAAF